MIRKCGEDPCATCSNRDCANSLLARWWDLCVESNFTLFKQIAPPLPGAIGPDAVAVMSETKEARHEE